MPGPFRISRGRPLKSAIVVGSGAGGATVARELQGRFSVTVIEAGKAFRPFPWNLRVPAAVKRAGWLRDARQIGLLFPAMKVDKAAGGLVHVRGIGTGGTTTISTGNGLRLDDDLKALGIDLDREFRELADEIPQTVEHRSRWRPATRKLFEAAREMGLDPLPTPKMGRYRQCRNCGRCVLGCPHGVKWDSRIFLNDALERGAGLKTGTRVERLEIRGGEAVGVVARSGFKRRLETADLIVLAAGGLGTPEILAASGIPGAPRLSVDPVLCVAARVPGAEQSRELPMPFYVHTDGFMISPYFDHLSFFFNRKWRPPAEGILSLMIKLADESSGSFGRGRLEKTLTESDRRRIDKAVGLCTEIFGRFGIPAEELFLGTLNAGHPGGMFPLTAAESFALHPGRLPGNVYIADASLFPAALGRPPILTVAALARKIARRAAGAV